ncbi:MAG: alpha-glucosidase [Bacteroidetes bacterium MedPE-SWsnd-G2]|nr:MAG: alpha-glucosidase [Bacteroidetes bacterium MedPE-SWsnd-G2]
MRGVLLILISVICFWSCEKEQTAKLNVSSPNKDLEIHFQLNKKGAPFYQVYRKNEVLIDTSFLGFELINQLPLTSNFEVSNFNLNSFNETWELPWGEQLEVESSFNELKVFLKEKTNSHRKVNIVFRVFDDGIGFRYEFPEQDNWTEAFIKEELTEFNLTEDYKTFWIPADWDSYEHLYSTTKVSEIDVTPYRSQNIIVNSQIPENAVHTPVTMVGESGVHLSFHEAALVDYSSMTLKVDTSNLILKSNLVGSKNTDYKVKRELPFHTPWRTIQVTNSAKSLLSSNLILNLNEPNKLKDVSWVKPMKYTGVWWEMHLNKSTWHELGGKHGATTDHVKDLIDFSAENNIKGVLVEGWNIGWHGDENYGPVDFVTPYPDYDLKALVAYGKAKGVEIIMHHETNANAALYEKQQDTAYALMKSLGIRAVKTGYVGHILPDGEYHHGQVMVNHFNNTVEKAAKYNIAVNAHEPIKATGLRRTYPNTISREGLRGQEFNAWSSDGGNPPEHLPIVAFTRMLSGPIDYTPGIFNLKFDDYKSSNQVNTTLAKQLGLYVVIYSPVQMAADLIEHYKGHEDVFQFIKDVGVDWSETKILDGDVGDFVTIARKERNSDAWFVGGITDENQRDLELNFDFLDPDKTYTATIYRDSKDAHWDENPQAIEIEVFTTTSSLKLPIYLAPGGGFAISLFPNR